MIFDVINVKLFYFDFDPTEQERSDCDGSFQQIQPEAMKAEGLESLSISGNVL